MRIFTIVLLLAFVTFGCKKNEVAPNNSTSYDYYPIDVGRNWIYLVDSIVLHGNETQKPDTFSYHVKITIDTTFLGADGITNYKVTKSIQRSNQSEFIFGSNFSVQKNSAGVTHNIQDRRLPILTFPIIEKIEWNGNLYTEKDEWNIYSRSTQKLECYYTNSHEEFTHNSTTYDSTCTIVRFKESNIVNERQSLEVYANHIGLVYKRFENQENRHTDDPKGCIYTYSLLSFEK